MASYQEEHPTIFLRVAMGVTILVCVGLAIGLPSPTVLRPVLGGVALVEAVLMGLMWTYRVEVDREALTVSFGPGFLRRRYPWKRVRGAALARTRSAGVRVKVRTVAWAAQPGGAVELELDDGWTVQIGTSQPQRLLAAIEAARS